MTSLETGVVFPKITLWDSACNPAPLSASETLYAFFKTTCPTTKMAWPFLERIRQIADGGPLRVLAVSQDDAMETEAFNRRLGVAVKTLYDLPPWRASETLGLVTVPAFFLVDREGTVREGAIGFQKKKMVAFAARAAELAGKPDERLFHPGESVPAIKPG
jgi:peroxiredoxin